MSNMKKLQSNVYICYTQAGFRKATKDFMFGDEETYPNRYAEEKENMVGFPKNYPSLVVMNWQYRGITYLHSTCIPITKTKLLKRHYLLYDPKEVDDA